ncbi:5111_t:CDS:2, partial [Acaulospora colombiana]
SPINGDGGTALLAFPFQVDDGHIEEFQGLTGDNVFWENPHCDDYSVSSSLIVGRNVPSFPSHQVFHS